VNEQRSEAARTGSAASNEAGAARASFRDRLRALRSGYMQIIGIPDYERYLGHMAAHHPGETPLSRREFCARSIDRKYGRSGPRCC
jgi:uncharacterized short protein YbdD (DUF466 family)